MEPLDIIPEVTIAINGQTHKVSCSFGVLIRFEALTGKDLLNDPSASKFTSSDVINFLACAVYPELYGDPERFSQAVKDLQESISGRHLRKVKEIINKIFDPAGPQEGKPEELPAT